MRVLFVTAAPVHSPLPWREIEYARLIALGLDITFWFAATLADLLSALQQKWDIVHFSGHGTEAGQLMLMNPQRDGEVLPVAGALLAAALQASPGISGLVLNACWGTELIEELEGTASWIIAAESELDNNAAPVFSEALYRGLLQGTPSEAACNTAKLIATPQGRSRYRFFGDADWTAPVQVAPTSTNALDVLLVYDRQTEGHSDLALALADRLRRNGVVALTDQYVVPQQLHAMGKAQWWAKQMERCQYIVWLFSEEGYRRVQAGEGGEEGWKWQNLKGLLYSGEGLAKIIAVLADGDGSESLPVVFTDRPRYRLPGDFESLFRHITGQVETPPPEVAEHITRLPTRQRSVLGIDGKEMGLAPQSPVKTNPPAPQSVLPAPEDTARVRALSGLLGKMFLTAEEIWHFLMLHSLELLDELPGKGVSKKKMCREAALRLVNDGLVDKGLFDLMRKENKRYKTEITEVEALWS